MAVVKPFQVITLTEVAIEFCVTEVVTAFKFSMTQGSRLYQFAQIEYSRSNNGALSLGEI